MITPLWSGILIGEVLAEEDGNNPSETDASFDALEDRLLGEIKEVPDEQNGINFQALPEQSFPLWVYPLVMLVVIGALLFAQRKRKSPVTPGEIRILSKTPLGREGSLAIVEIGSDNGDSKKLLLGLHGNSAPRLIDYVNSEQVIAMVSDDAYSDVYRENRENRENTRGFLKNSSGESFDSFLSREAEKEQQDKRMRRSQNVNNDEDNQSDRNNRNSRNNRIKKESQDSVLEDRNDLVDEVLKARGLSATQGIERYQQVANEPYPPLDFDESEEEDPWAAGFRNIYNQKSK